MPKPWVFEFCHLPGLAADRPPSGAELAAGTGWLLDLWAGFESIGFEGLFLSEHHFLPRGISPSPNLLLAAIAQRTSRLRLGVMGLVAPLHSPWRLVEELGMLDILTNGRLEIGLSSGSGPMEFVRLGIDPAEIRSRFDEALDIVEAALRGGPVTHAGTFWQGRDLPLTPAMVQSKPPVWVTGLSPGSAIGVARRGQSYCTGFLPTEQVAALFETYRQTRAEAGNPATPDALALRRLVHLTDDAGEAREIKAAALTRLHAALGSGKKPHDAPAANTAVPDAPRPQQQAVGDDEAIAGTPAQVAEAILAQTHACGAGHFLAYTFADLTREQVHRNYALWRQVLSTLRRAEAA